LKCAEATRESDVLIRAWNHCGNPGVLAAIEARLRELEHRTGASLGLLRGHPQVGRQLTDLRIIDRWR
jgi:hypothetical protein